MSRDETGEVNRGPIMEGFEGILILSWEQWATIEWFEGKKQKLWHFRMMTLAVQEMDQNGSRPQAGRPIPLIQARGNDNLIYGSDNGSNQMDLRNIDEMQ